MNSPLLPEARQFHTFDMDTLNRALNYLKINTKKHVQEVQEDTAGLLARFDLSFTREQLDKVFEIQKEYARFPLHHRMEIPFSFIRPSERSAYKRSSFYEKMLDFDTIARNTHLFSTNLLLFVDGMLLSSWKILCKEDFTYLYIPVKENWSSKEEITGTPLELFNQWVDRQVDITLLFVANTMEVRKYTTGRTVFHADQYRIPKSQLRPIREVNYPEMTPPLVFVTPSQHQGHYRLVDVTSTSNLRYQMNRDDFDDAQYVHFLQYRFANDIPWLEERTDHRGSIALPYQKIPYHTKNMIVFIKDEGHWKFLHHVDIQCHFHSVYQFFVNGNPLSEKELRILPFYRENEPDYLNYLPSDEEFYQIVTPNSLMEDLSQIQARFQEVFGEVEDPLDYTHAKFFADDKVMGDSTKFKIDALNHMARHYGWALSVYNHFLGLENNEYYIDLKGRDLTKRIRNSTVKELGSEMTTVVFDEPHYVFLFHRDFTKDRSFLRLYIDGVFFIPTHMYYGEQYLYVYIPTRLVRDDSFIEVEKFYDYSWSTKFTVIDTERTKEFHPPKAFHHPVRVNDIFIVNEAGEYVLESDYEIQQLIDGEWTIVREDSFREIGEEGFRIRIKSDQLVGQQITLTIQRMSDYEIEVFTEDSAGEEEIPDFRIFIRGNNDKRHLRVFRNGHILPMNYYKVEFGTKPGENHSLAVLQERRRGDSYMVDYTPYKYTQVFFQKEIPQEAVFDLRGKIQRPLNLLWYDIYVNGRRLTKRDIHIITPTRFAIKNHVKSLKNLLIIQKDRDIDYFRLGDDQVLSYVDMLMGFRQIELKIMEFYNKIEEEQEDAYLPLIDEVMILILRFYRDDLTFSFINPDEQQIDDPIIKKYGLMLDELQNFFINPDHGESRSLMPIVP